MISLLDSMMYHSFLETDVIRIPEHTYKFSRAIAWLLRLHHLLDPPLSTVVGTILIREAYLNAIFSLTRLALYVIVIPSQGTGQVIENGPISSSILKLDERWEDPRNGIP